MFSIRLFIGKNKDKRNSQIIVYYEQIDKMELFNFFYAVLRFFKIQFSWFEFNFESNLNHLAMKRFVLFSFLNLCLIVGVLAQNQDKKQNQPKENSKVTKEYDEKGNLTKFDSVYTYS